MKNISAKAAAKRAFACAILCLSLFGCADNKVPENGGATSGTEKTESGTTAAITDGAQTEKSEENEVTEQEFPAYSSLEEFSKAKLAPLYDSGAVLEAYRSGDVSELSEKDLAIYEAALDALSEFYREGMSEVEIVTAAHDWVTTHLFYDEGMMLAIPKKSPDTENPYGGLVLRRGICTGYSTTFQLFMDMLGIDSQIVRGIAFGTDIWEEHSWNLVCLNGKYYHVDTTWDDFVPDEEGRIPFHTYLLVDDSAMETLHQWDHSAWPAAEYDDLNYFVKNGLYASKKSEIEAIQEDAYSKGWTYCEVMTDSDKLISFSKHAYAYWTTDLGEYYVTVYWIEQD